MRILLGLFALGFCALCSLASAQTFTPDLKAFRETLRLDLAEGRAAFERLHSTDPMHDFERCMDALWHLDLPENFPAGEFCNLFEEQR